MVLGLRNGLIFKKTKYNFDIWANFCQKKSEGGSKELCICSLVFLAKIFGWHQMSFYKNSLFLSKKLLKEEKIEKKILKFWKNIFDPEGWSLGSKKMIFFWKKISSLFCFKLT